MLAFFSSNIPLVVGALLALILIGVRAASGDKAFRADLRGAIVFLIAFLAVRSVQWAAGGYLPVGVDKLLLVGWMLLFAFGCIRAGVSVLLRPFRFNGRPAPKILRDLLDATLYVLAAVPILKSQLAIDLTGLLATSAIVSVVIGLALQETLGNLFAGLSIQLERPFQVGDYVTVRDHTGKVVQIAWRATRIETFRREIVAVPNNILSKEAVKNYSRGPEPVAIDLYFVTSHEAPPNQVKAAVREVLEHVPFVLEDPMPHCRAWGFEEAGMRYQIRFFVADFAQSDDAMDELYSRLWYRFRRDGIDLAFPRQDLRLRPAESQPEISKENLLGLLGSVDLFSLVPRAEHPALAEEIVARRFGRGERVIQQGDEGHTFYIVAEGEVAIRTGQPEVEIARLSPGGHFGEMSLLTGEPTSATVVAAKDCLLLELERSTFARLFDAHPGLARQLSAMLAERRSQLRAVAHAPAAAEETPEAGRIFTRLRQIFRLSHD